MVRTITYNKLWELLIDMYMSRSELKTVTGVSTAFIARLGKGENITTGVLNKICEDLQCELTDIMEVVVDVEVDEVKEEVVSLKMGQRKE